VVGETLSIGVLERVEVPLIKEKVDPEEGVGDPEESSGELESNGELLGIPGLLLIVR